MQPQLLLCFQHRLYGLSVAAAWTPYPPVAFTVPHHPAPLLLPPPLRLAELGLAPSLLDTQYRMHPAIAQFPAAWFYAGRLKDGVTAQQKPPPAGLAWPVPGWPVAVVEVSWSGAMGCCVFCALSVRCCPTVSARAATRWSVVCIDMMVGKAVVGDGMLLAVVVSSMACADCH
jgi:hypothetical protein